MFKGSKSDPVDSIPQNDAEKWAVAAYALWSEYCGGNCKYFGGYEKNRSNASMARGVLNRDWAVTNKQGVAETVDYLIAEKNNVGGEYAQAYIQGVGMESGVADKVVEFEENYKRLVSMPDGPYTVDWETPIG